MSYTLICHETLLFMWLNSTFSLPLTYADPFARQTHRYLEQHDKAMHQRAKAQIKDCYEKNKSGDPAFKSLTQSMEARLRATVGEMYWKKAHDYLEPRNGGQSQQRPSSSGGVPG
jgi:hypothetical protein